MKALTLLALLFFPAGSALELTTDYASSRTLAIEGESAWTLTVSELEMLRDGEPFERPEDRERPGVSEARHFAFEDTVLEQEDGTPMRVRRAFGTIGSEIGRDGGPGREIESPLSDVTLELERSDDGVDVSVLDGDSPDSEQLEGHRLELALDALLPDGAIEVGDEWELDDDMLQRALGFDIDAALFPTPEPEERDEERSRRGRMAGGRESIGALLARAEWEGTATLADDDDELDGVPCLRIEIEVEASGSFDDELEGGGRGGTMQRETSVDIDLDGDFFFSLDERRPVLLRLEGDLSIERHMSRSGGERSFEVTMVQDGEFSHSTLISVSED